MTAQKYAYANGLIFLTTFAVRQSNESNQSHTLLFFATITNLCVQQDLPASSILMQENQKRLAQSLLYTTTEMRSLISGRQI